MVVAWTPPPPPPGGNGEPNPDEPITPWSEPGNGFAEPPSKVIVPGPGAAAAINPDDDLIMDKETAALIGATFLGAGGILMIAAGGLVYTGQIPAAGVAVGGAAVAVAAAGIFLDFAFDPPQTRYRTVPRPSAFDAETLLPPDDGAWAQARRFARATGRLVGPMSGLLDAQEKHQGAELADDAIWMEIHRHAGLGYLDEAMRALEVMSGTTKDLLTLLARQRRGGRGLVRYWTRLQAHIEQRGLPGYVMRPMQTIGASQIVTDRLRDEILAMRLTTQTAPATAFRARAKEIDDFVSRIRH